MQLHYNIIWIDDEIDKLQEAGDVNQISDFLSSLGFNPFILTLKDGKNIEQSFDKYKFDLIISDYNIEEGHHGDSIIKEIRNRRIFVEVLFYTSQTNLQAIAEKLLGYDRISFHIGRRGLTEKIEGLIKLSVSKLLELNATRGLVTDETSELDVIIEDLVINLVYDKLKLENKDIEEIINFYVDDFLKKSPDFFMKRYKEIGFKKQFHTIEASRKWRIFRALLKKIDSQNVKEFLELNKTYFNEVIDIRNKFAHAKTIEKDGKLYLAGFGPDEAPFEFDEAHCIEIRKNLIKHRENLNKLSKHLGIELP